MRSVGSQSSSERCRDAKRPTMLLAVNKSPAPDMTADRLEAHIHYILSVQTHKLAEARRRCKVFTLRYSETPTRQQLDVWRRQMSEFDLARSERNLGPAVAELARVEAETQAWANRNMKPLMDWTRAPQGLLRRHDN